MILVGIHYSTIARDLIREAIDLREDVALADVADTRMMLVAVKIIPKIAVVVLTG